MNEGDNLPLDVWWTCHAGYLHVERSPVTIEWDCGWAAGEGEDPQKAD